MVKNLDYSKTVNLPKTDFPMKADLPRREPQFLEFWQQRDIYRSRLKKNSAGAVFILHDGPPYANGHIHLGHALNKILKDIVVRYKLFTGHFAPFVPGWDCHGLPIEQQLLKELKMSRQQIDRTSFRRQAAEFAQKFVAIQREEFKRLGIVGEWEKPYLTMTPEYEGKIVEAFADLVEGGYIYRQKKPVYWCISCETALAEAEVEYAPHISPSIMVKFPVVSGAPWPVEKNTSVLIWTTTPWTLPANVALAFNPRAIYLRVKLVIASKEQDIIVAEERLPALTETRQATVKEIVGRATGSELENLICLNPLNGNQSRAVLADFVSLTDGTGIVHIAPGHGAEDYLVGKKYNLAILSPVDARGVFTDEVKDFAGHKVFAANQLIVEKLKQQDSLLLAETLSHSYPHCWRCKRAVIFRATEQWFLNVDHQNLRQKMLENIKNVSWYPPVGQRRIGAMIELRPDWCLSRQRYWGTPVPVLYCNSCNQPVVSVAAIRRLARLFARQGSDVYFNYSMEELLKIIDPENNLRCPHCNKRDFRRENDILDVWFDSGVSHIAVLKNPDFGLSWPADMYLEGSDQHRGWFQTSLIPAVAIYGKAPYRQVLTHGFVVDGAGKKMSKSEGNVITPQEIIDQYGADILRLWVASADYQEDIRISEEILQILVDTYRKIRNTIRFILGNIADLNDSEYIQWEKRREIDQYLISRWYQDLKEIRQAYESYEFYRVVNIVNNFCVRDLSNFYLDVLKDCLYTFPKNHFVRRSAQSTLYDIGRQLLITIAPILPFTAEDGWQNFFARDTESIFLKDFPESPDLREPEMKLLKVWGKILEVRDKVNEAIENARRNNIIRASLQASLEITVADEELYLLLAERKDDLAMIFIVSRVLLKKNPAATEPLLVKVNQASGKKCARCWIWSETVGQNKKYPDICERCAKFLEDLP